MRVLGAKLPLQAPRELAKRLDVRPRGRAADPVRAPEAGRLAHVRARVGRVRRRVICRRGAVVPDQVPDVVRAKRLRRLAVGAVVRPERVRHVPPGVLHEGNRAARVALDPVRDVVHRAVDGHPRVAERVVLGDVGGGKRRGDGAAASTVPDPDLACAPSSPRRRCGAARRGSPRARRERAGDACTPWRIGRGCVGRAIDRSEEKKTRARRSNGRSSACRGWREGVGGGAEPRRSWRRCSSRARAIRRDAIESEGEARARGRGRAFGRGPARGGVRTPAGRARVPKSRGVDVTAGRIAARRAARRRDAPSRAMEGGGRGGSAGEPATPCPSCRAGASGECASEG